MQKSRFVHMPCNYKWKNHFTYVVKKVVLAMRSRHTTDFTILHLSL